MTAYFPTSPSLAHAIEQPEPLLVLCFCAAWCDACKAYQPKFDALATEYPQANFVWIDIEEYPDLLGDEDVENFPTIALLQGDDIRFMGTLLPHIEHLKRLIETMQSPGKPQETGLPEDLRTQLKKLSQAQSA